MSHEIENIQASGKGHYLAGPNAYLKRARNVAKEYGLFPLSRE
jgi:hypothetical protein